MNIENTHFHAVLKALLTVFMALPLAVGMDAQTFDNEPDPLSDEFEDDSYLRENPEIDIDYLSNYSDIFVPGFIDNSKNVINLNGGDWSDVIEKFKSSGPQLISIVHIGDSHIQAEISTNVVRERMQLSYGSAGRGLIAPLKLSGTNQPIDYKFDSSSSWSVDKIMRAGWANPMGFNGMSITFNGSSGNFTVSTPDNDDFADPFMRLTVYHTGDWRVATIHDEYDSPVVFTQYRNGGITEVILDRAITTARVNFNTENPFTLHGVVLSGDRPGLFYHAIGNNGAAFATYNRISAFSSGISTLKPDIIIVSLGTNEAFGAMDRNGFRTSVQTFVNRLQTSCPDSKILITTPMECQRKYRVGKRRRKTTSYAVNATVKAYRDELLDFCQKNAIACYDWFDIAGGEGASTRWLDAHLLGGDRIHYTSAGYRLNGLLLYQALYNLIEGNTTDNFLFD